VIFAVVFCPWKPVPVWTPLGCCLTVILKKTRKKNKLRTRPAGVKKKTCSISRIASSISHHSEHIYFTKNKHGKRGSNPGLALRARHNKILMKSTPPYSLRMNAVPNSEWFGKKVRQHSNGRHRLKKEKKGEERRDAWRDKTNDTRSTTITV